MSDEYNEYGIRQIDEKIHLANTAVTISKKKKDDVSTVKWLQFSKFNKKMNKWENFTLFGSNLEVLSVKLPSILDYLKDGNAC
ncbi:MAG: hypothetical protein PWQ75_2439 [Methanolobus sp.]|jgi:hypothetical protein|uniref:hypothetical protein n=1 Tax=Methanolobus sp. TaxID=1874737 RepID=UPI00258997FF|nr:hypothetical protein [Methanolobus sp.]MDK2832687.1 hypothetical protein [Methanolobus sp.]